MGGPGGVKGAQDAIQLVSATSRELEIKWTVPEANGASIDRYDPVGGPNVRVLRWALLTTSFLETTVSSDKVFNADTIGGVEFGEIEGGNRLGDLFCDIALYAPLRAESNVYKVPNLLPGQEYYFAFRAVGGAGKGSFSDLVGPFTTRSEEPCPCEACYLNKATSSTCQI